MNEFGTSYDEEITYHQFKNWVVQQVVSFIMQKIPRLYVQDRPKKSLREWMQEFVEWCDYHEIVEEK